MAPRPLAKQQSRGRRAEQTGTKAAHTTFGQHMPKTKTLCLRHHRAFMNAPLHLNQSLTARLADPPRIYEVVNATVAKATYWEGQLSWKAALATRRRNSMTTGSKRASNQRDCCNSWALRKHNQRPSTVRLQGEHRARHLQATANSSVLDCETGRPESALLDSAANALSRDLSSTVACYCKSCHSLSESCTAQLQLPRTYQH